MGLEGLQGNVEVATSDGLMRSIEQVLFFIVAPAGRPARRNRGEESNRERHRARYGGTKLASLRGLGLAWVG